MKSNDVLKFNQFIARSPESVWRALTDPGLLAKWWVPGDIKPVVGHRFTLDLGPWGTQQCQVLEVEEKALLSHTFAEGLLNAKIVWCLVPEGSGTRLFLEHGGFDTDTPQGKQAFDGMGRGWPSVINRIEDAMTEPRKSQQ